MFEISILKKQALRLWDNQSIFHGVLSNANLFPLYLSFPAISSRKLMDNFILVRAQISTLIEQCQRYKLLIQFKEVKHRQLGAQRIPELICFNTLDDYLRFIGKEKEYKQFCSLLTLILSEGLVAKDWLLEHSEKVLHYQDNWGKLLRVCRYFQQHPLPNKYMRELEVSGVDSKFIEQNKVILSQLLNAILPESAINNEPSLSRRYDFEVRFGLKYQEPQIRFRILDKSLTSFPDNWCASITDFTLPLSQFAKLELPCRRIFITENKINGLSFPQFPEAIVIFGLGYGIQSLKNVSWLKDKEITYWGDIDTHGFAILSQLRSYYPQAQSMLMDITTLNMFKDMWVDEPVHTRCTASLAHLTSDEEGLYQALLANQMGEFIRLEQERVSYTHLVKTLGI